MFVNDSLFQFVAVLKEIGEVGLCHCDLHSGNVLIKFDPRTEVPKDLFLIDFGSASHLHYISREDINASVKNVPPEMLLGRK